MRDKGDFDIARREVLLRRIGHELLLQSGDSTSRVLPVKKAGENEYRVSFEKDFTFQPDSLVNTTRRLLANDPLTGGYVVNVLNGSNSVAYGFAISGKKKDDIVACTGRKQPKASYFIDIKFEPTDTHILKTVTLLGSLPVLAFVGFMFLRSAKPKKISNNNQISDQFSFGNILFNAKERRLIVDENIIELTGTEARLLLIFAQSPNQTIERSRLQKEIWEDEGIIVGRSLDMFISKLRKKLEQDPDVKIVVIRGKGYKLDVGEI